MILDVLACGDAQAVAKRSALYRAYGFSPLASNPLRLFLPVAATRQLTEL